MSDVSDMILQVRQLADMQNTQFVTDTEILFMLNQGLQDAYNAVVRADEAYFSSSQSVTFTAGSCSLPTDCMKIIGVDLIIGSKTYTLRRFNFGERNKYNSSQVIFRYGNYKYNIQNNTVRLLPTPSQTYTGTIWYTPYPTLMVAGGSLDYPLKHFDCYMIYSAVAQCLAKEQSSNTYWDAQAKEAMQQIIQTVPNRDMGESDSVVDIYTQNYDILF